MQISKEYLLRIIQEETRGFIDTIEVEDAPPEDLEEYEEFEEDDDEELEEYYDELGEKKKRRKKKKKKKKRKKKGGRCTKRSTKKTASTRKGKKWMKCVNGKRVHWGQKGVRVTGKSGNTKRKKSFKARHGCSSAKAGTPKAMACRDWAE